jgi:hypothetical protein
LRNLSRRQEANLEARPVYLRTNAHINARFLICFIALLIARIVEPRLDGKYPIDRIVETLRKGECSIVDQNLWLFDHTDEITDNINAVFGMDFGLKMMTLKISEKIWGWRKKSGVYNMSSHNKKPATP